MFSLRNKEKYLPKYPQYPYLIWSCADEVGHHELSQFDLIQLFSVLAYNPIALRKAKLYIILAFLSAKGFSVISA